MTKEDKAMQEVIEAIGSRFSTDQTFGISFALCATACEKLAETAKTKEKRQELYEIAVRTFSEGLKRVILELKEEDEG